MIDRENIVLVPGAMRNVEHYGDFNGLDIWMGESDEEISPDVKCFIGHSLGVNHILNLNIESGNKFIFINPLVRRRNIVNLFVRWLKFMMLEGLSRKTIVPIRYWIHTFKQALFLLKTDVLDEMKKIPGKIFL